MAYDPDANQILSRQAARILTVLVWASVACLVVGLTGHHIDPATRWPQVLIKCGTGVVVAAPIIALGRIAAGAPSRRLSALAMLGILVAMIGALVAR